MSRLDALATAGMQKALACLTRQPRASRRASSSSSSRASALPAPVTYELFGDEVLRRANALSFGRDQLPTFDLPNARHVLSFGADFLGTWNSPVSQTRRATA